MMPTTTKPRQLPKAAFVQRIRELLDEGLDHDQVVAKLNPCRGPGLTEAFTTDAVEAITSALAIAPVVGNKAMTEAHTRFIGQTRLADEFDAGLPKKQSRLRQQHVSDPPIIVHELERLEAERVRLRASADEAAAQWQDIQRRRIPFDRARLDFPSAFSEFLDWRPKAIT